MNTPERPHDYDETPEVEPMSLGQIILGIFLFLAIFFGFAGAKWS